MDSTIIVVAMFLGLFIRGFVLGDFSAQSKDSRLWEQGAPGHQPFAVPASYLQGVVTHIYWPPQRWRILRRSLRRKT